MRGRLYLTFLLQLCIVYCIGQNVVINEILADNDKIIADSAGDFDDVLELYNPTSEEIDLFHYYLSDDTLSPFKFRFGNVQIGPGEFLLVWCDEEFLEPGIHTNFKLSTSGETLIFSDSSKVEIDRVIYPQLSEDVSWARYPDGETFKYMYPTIGSPNVFLDNSSETARNTKQLIAYPNPLNSGELLYLVESVSYKRLYDINGRIVKVVPKGQSYLETHGLQAGVYFLSANNERFKVIVQ